MQNEWWKEFFEGPAAEVWHRVVTPEWTQAEAEFLARWFDPGSQVLDVPCGDGRLAVALAQRGMQVTGVDGSALLLGHARVASAGLPVTWRRSDMRELPWAGVFDGAWCLGNSFGYLGDEGDATFLAAVHTALRPGGRFVLEAASAEAVFPRFQPRRWWPVGDWIFASAVTYDPLEGRVCSEYTVVHDGKVSRMTAWQRVRCAREVIAMLRAAGFADVQLYGGIKCAPLGLGGDQPALFVAVA
ncbi:MAG: methyltransferase domain-containing protein [Planctomycetes bacterium]|nr:methyltransferase domain-containing protein [Planctomycetota bacterium]